MSLTCLLHDKLQHGQYRLYVVDREFNHTKKILLDRFFSLHHRHDRERKPDDADDIFTLPNTGVLGKEKGTRAT